MKKEDAIEKLTDQIKTIDNFASLRFSPDFYQWKIDTEIAIKRIFGNNNEYLTHFKEINFTATYALGDYYNRTEGISEDGLQKSRAILRSMINEVENNWDKWKVEQTDVTHNLSVITNSEIIKIICDRFHLFARKLEIRRSDRSTIKIIDEYDVQYLFHALLTLYFDDIREEEYTPSYAGGASRVDFLLKEEQTVIELKKTREKLTDKEVGEQLIIDIARYKSHSDCKTLICFVYDPERRIKNPRGLENDLSKTTDGMIVQVFIRPT
ncbi:MAG: hypothetical protein HEQ13_10070 [Dolichospermum sp. DEX189]|jgi:hypothetical protein|nr:hypothetical protein [Dolichospermum sp. DEX189]